MVVVKKSTFFTSFFVKKEAVKSLVGIMMERAWILLTSILSWDMIFDSFSTQNSSFLSARLSLLLRNKKKWISYGVKPMHA